MKIFNHIGFKKVTKQLNTALSFLRDPETIDEQEEIWRKNDGDISSEFIDPSKDQLRTRNLMDEFKTNVRGMKADPDLSLSELKREGGARLNSTQIFLEISKTDVEVIYQVKEAYL